MVPLPPLPLTVPALAAFTAATALNKFPLLGLLLAVLRVAPPGNAALSRSTRFKKGLGRFSSSEKSYSGAGGDDCGTVTDDFPARPECEDVDRFTLAAVRAATAGDDAPVGSDVGPGRVTDRRIDGRRKRDGGAVEDCAGACCVGVESDFRTEGDGGSSASVSSSPSDPSSECSSKSNIFAKLSPTFGELTKRLANSAGEGVATVSPVAVKTTPFIAEG